MTKRGALKDQTGRKFGRLTAVELVSVDEKWGDHKWRFICDCGNEKVAGIKQVRSGHTSSCGCLFSEMMDERNRTHGLSHHKATYRSWKDMRARCTNPHDSDYAGYGGRGISVCARWDDFAAFFEDMGARPTGMTLDRINVHGDYSPSNCRWATDETQANNKRSNRFIEFNGETKTLAQWCRVFSLDHSKVRYRLSRGWPLAKAFGQEDYRIVKNSRDTDG